MKRVARGAGTVSHDVVPNLGVAVPLVGGGLPFAFLFLANGGSLGPSKGRTIMVHNGVMGSANKTVRQSVSLPATTAAKVRSLAKTRRLSANRMIVELIENGIEAEKRKQQEFFELAERFRDASDPEEAKRLGDELGRMVFGG
jgi:hypothetical protein